MHEPLSVQDNMSLRDLVYITKTLKALISQETVEELIQITKGRKGSNVRMIADLMFCETLRTKSDTKSIVHYVHTHCENGDYSMFLKIATASALCVCPDEDNQFGSHLGLDTTMIPKMNDFKALALYLSLPEPTSPITPFKFDFASTP